MIPLRVLTPGLLSFHIPPHRSDRNTRISTSTSTNTNTNTNTSTGTRRRSQKANLNSYIVGNDFSPCGKLKLCGKAFPLQNGMSSRSLITDVVACDVAGGSSQQAIKQASKQASSKQQASKQASKQASMEASEQQAARRVLSTS
jgi:hypothetical protein